MTLVLSRLRNQGVLCVKCTVCAQETRIERTRRVAGDRHVARRRVCDSGHRFWTEERPTGLRLDTVQVRRSGDQRLAEGGFDVSRLVRDVQRGVLKRMTDDEVREVVRQAILDLEMRLSGLVHPLSDGEQRDRPGYKLAVMDSVIREAVEQRLRRYGRRMPHVLYALSTLGRADRQGRSGFQHAGHVLRWMGEEANYPDLAVQVDLEPVAMPTDYWWPQGSPPLPDRVIKRDLTRRKGFLFDQFISSISEAMLGRPEAKEKSYNVAAWTLWGLAGQREVLTAQLAVGVMECLRRVDDIAYLRWTSISKSIESVADFRDEALGLLRHPSPRLVFAPDGAPRFRPERPTPET